MATSRIEHIRNLRNHDVYYSFSDDNSVYRRGAAERNALVTAEQNNPELTGMLAKYLEWYTMDAGVRGEEDPFENELPRNPG